MPFHRILRMGCGISKVDANGVATPNRSILPHFHHRKRQSNKRSPNSKKEPLLMMPENNDDRPSVSVPKCDDNLISAISNGYTKDHDDKRIAKIRTIVEEAEKNDLHEDDGAEETEEEKNDDDERAISKVRVHKEDGSDFPASPSFRVYFDDKDDETKKTKDGYNRGGLKNITPVASTTSTTKVCM